MDQLGLSHLKGGWVHKVTLLYWREYIRASPPYHDAAFTVSTLKRRGYKLGLVSDTDGTPGMKLKRIRSLPFYNLFRGAVVVAGEDTQDIKIKPSASPFRLAAKRLKLPGTDCVYVGDNPKADVIGAKRIGMQTILVKRRKLKGPKPTLVIKSLSNLLSIFQGPGQGGSKVSSY